MRSASGISSGTMPELELSLQPRPAHAVPAPVVPHRHVGLASPEAGGRGRAALDGQRTRRRVVRRLYPRR